MVSIVDCAKIPSQVDALDLRILNDTLTVSLELGVVGRQQHQSSQNTLAERVDDLTVTTCMVYLPVWSNWSQIDNPGARYWSLINFCNCHISLAFVSPVPYNLGCTLCPSRRIRTFDGNKGARSIGVNN